MMALEYKRWDKFCNVIENTKIACEKSNNIMSYHFSQVGRMVEIGSKASRNIMDVKLSRYACYLIVQNADPRKEIVALGQTYFAIQTRKQEITEQEYDSLSDDEKRFYQRKLTRRGNYTLQKVASTAGVKNMAEFHNAGYRGLYNGEIADDIFRRKKVLSTSGNISHNEAVEKAENEYEKYRVVQDQKYISSMDKFYNRYLNEARMIENRSERNG